MDDPAQRHPPAVDRCGSTCSGLARRRAVSDFASDGPRGWSEATGINNAGEIIGNSGILEGVPFIYRDGVMMRLLELIEASDPLRSEARYMNNCSASTIADRSSLPTAFILRAATCAITF